MGNICRSPSAEIIFRQMVADAGLTARIEIDSAGTIGSHAGSPPDRRMADALRARGYAISGTARRVTYADLEHFDLILAMDDNNYDDLISLAQKNAGLTPKIRRFVEFCARQNTPLVPDPYYGGPEGFERVADILEDGCQGLLDFLRKAI
jgi:protein-tyrosine phosphatase